MGQIGFSKEITNAVKGVALLLMLVLHFFCFPSWYIEGVDMKMNWLENYQGHFQICVAVFSFLSGYMYCFAKEKTLKYSLKKVLDTAVPYWCAFLLLFVIALLTGYGDFSAKSLLLEFFTIEHAVIPFGWYVTFYICMMLLFPLIVFLFRGNAHIIAITGLLFPVAGYYVCSRLGLPALIMGILEKFQVYFPIAAMGYWGADQGIFEKLDRLLQNKWLRLAVNIGLVIIVFMEPGWLYSLPFHGTALLFVRKCIRIASILLFMWSLISILKMAGSKFAAVPAFIGKYSLMMWFAHCIFFNVSREIFQPILFFTTNPVVVYLWGLLLTLLLSIPMDWIARKARSLIGRVLC